VPPPGSGGGGSTLAGESGVGRVPIPTREHTFGTLYIYVLCGQYIHLIYWDRQRCHTDNKAIKKTQLVCEL
jgi:hypothetical protein